MANFIPSEFSFVDLLGRLKHSGSWIKFVQYSVNVAVLPFYLIPISGPSQDVWHFDKCGIYTVKSRYNVASHYPQSLWNPMACVTQCVTEKCRLQQRCIFIDTICVCSASDEDLIERFMNVFAVDLILPKMMRTWTHALLTCHKARAVWQYL